MLNPDKRPTLEFCISTGDVPVEQWLETRDAQPRLLPRWPKSQRMTLVALLAEASSLDAVTTPHKEGQLHIPLDGELSAYVITSKELAAAVVDYTRLRESAALALFFLVSRTVVLDVCEGLSPTSWVV